MAKRKRHGANGGEAVADAVPKKKSKATETAKPKAKPSVPETIQLVAGSYDQVLHGMTAAIGPRQDTADFADTFLFNAHTSAIRCVAVSPASAPVPGQTQKVLLASGSTDERINIYNLSAHPPSKKNQDVLAKVAPRPILENPKNRELGTLLHHASTVTALHFPTRSKLLSASEDSTIAVTRTRDWSVLSNIKVPKAKAQGRPSGDTAAFGATPAGVNEFAIHPSMKVMISVSKGERCIRLWNLVTGKKAGVLGFSRELLQAAGEGKHSSGEGRTVVWGSADGADEYAVGFDRGAVVFGMDSVPKCIVLPSPSTKIHQLRYVTMDEEAGLSLLAVSTEDGRIAFFSTRDADLSEPTEQKDDKTQPLKVAKLVGYVGGREVGVAGRIKDFVALPSEANKGTLYVAGASSEGKVRLWTLQAEELVAAMKETTAGPMGKLLGTYETQNRITCLAGFVMIPRPEGAEDSDDEVDDDDEDSDESEHASDED
ncbi:Protein mak11 [Purpureocillium takamizusanense]|uniref:Protein mak11 n=1 Tax=Purpureocillium takamizusanense TaxID=2060973 RepID=A0A9Q8QK33_9HYPO|nr:Protein mak11 [Purpureocillium takamizusanense]UNI21343.1 Protein mak11 [Purpureocillium takamizusanense]